MADLTDDEFLGGRLKLLQPKTGYRAGVDPVLLAAACSPRPAARVLDLGCGVGTALFCLHRRIDDLQLFGFDADTAFVELAKQNAVRNDIPANFIIGNVSARPPELRGMSFDLIMANPPYFDRAQSASATNPSREQGRGESVQLADWIRLAARRLAPKGQAVFIQRAERLPEMFAACEGALGSVEVIPIQARPGDEARHIILRARKGGAARFRLYAPVVLHRSVGDKSKSAKYRPEIEQVLRHAAPLPIP